jgi:nucleoid-associated protein YgaU
MGRYDNDRIIENNSKYYSPLRRSRKVKNIIHYATPVLYNPTPIDRMMVRTNGHIWKYGDRLYKLAHAYYGDSRYWWVIAWYNGVPTEADLFAGDLIDIPINIEQALKILGAY